MDDLKKQGTIAFIWDFTGKMATHGMGFIVSIFLARLLEPADFGLIAMVMVIIGLASIFTDIGLGGAIIQRRRLHSIHYSSVFYFNVLIGLALTITTYLSASIISRFYNNEELLPIVEAMSLLFFINALSGIQVVRLRKELNYALLTKIGLISSLFSGVVGVSMAFRGFGVWSLVAQTLTQGIAYNTFIWMKTTWRPQPKFSWKALMQLWGFGFRMFLSGILETIFTRLDFLIIGKLFPSSTLGYFQRAKALNNMVLLYSSASLMSVIFPVLTKIQSDLPRFQNIIIKTLNIISFIVFLLLGGLYLVSEELIVLLFSAKWVPSVSIFKILVLSGFGYPFGALLVSVLSSRGNSKGFLKLEIYKKTIVLFNLIILVFYGFEAYLYGLIFVAFSTLLINIKFASYEISLPILVFLRPILIQMLISVVSVLITFLVTNYVLVNQVAFFLIKGLIFTLLYVAISYMMNTNSINYVYEQLLFIMKNKFSN